MTRTPDEIKKGLECCYEGIDCSTKCPYVEACFGNDETPFGAVMPDALALIQQLQDDNAEKDKRIQELERSLSFARDLADGLKAATVKQEQEHYVSEERNRQLESQNDELIQKVEQLQAERDVLDYTLAGVMHFVDKWLDVEPYKIDGPTGNDAVTRAALAREIALKAIEKAQAERDAAVKDMHEAQACLCLICKNYKRDQDGNEIGCKVFGDFPFENSPIICGQFEWRGVQKEGQPT